MSRRIVQSLVFALGAVALTAGSFLGFSIADEPSGEPRVGYPPSGAVAFNELEVLRRLRSPAYDFGESVSLPDQVAAQRTSLIASLKQLQDAYCRAGMLDEAIAVRDEVRSLESLQGSAYPPVVDRLADPGVGPASTSPTQSPYALRGRNGESFFAEVTGNLNGSVWGNEIYTDDSDLVTAAVHAGVVKDGETAIVKFTILEGQPSYAGSAQNGVTARDWPSYVGSYRVDAAGRPSGSLYSLRGETGRIVKIHAMGEIDGSVWGSGVYTNDSSVGAAAVHAGVLQPGEENILSIELLDGRSSYEGSSANGVTSRDYTTWDASFRFVTGAGGSDVDQPR